jgi:hypothetical protein
LQYGYQHLGEYFYINLLVVLLSWFSMVEVCVLSMVLVYRVSCLF